MSGWTRFDRTCKHCVALHDELVGRPVGAPPGPSWHDRWSLHVRAKHPAMADWFWPFPTWMPEEDRIPVRRRRIEDMQRRMGL